MRREQYILDRVYDEHDSIEIEEATIEMLNQTYNFSPLGGPFTYMLAGVVLKEYDDAAFREEVNNYQDAMIRDGSWIEYGQACWLPEAKKLIDYITSSIKDVDPIECTGIEHPGFYYFDSESISQGPFESAEACYNHACP
jgi:hypothetical protein